MEEYLNMEIERDRSDYPTGLKHFSKDTLAENSLFDIELMKHKAIGIAKGTDDGKENTAGHKAESEETPSEVRRGLCERLLHADRHTEELDGKDRGVTEQYLGLDEREREADEESDSVIEAKD